MPKSALDFNKKGSGGKIEQYLPEQNAQRIAQIAGAIAGGGEVNTGSNVGTDGVGVFDAKVVYDLQFRHIASVNAKLTVVLNGKDIDLTVVVGTTADTVCVGNDARLSDARTPTAHILATTGPHTGTLPWTDLDKTGSSLADLATRAHGDLSDAPSSAHHVRYADSEAVSAVETTGLSLAATKVIVSENANLAFIFGRSQIGNTAVATAIFSYRGLGTSSFALRQSSGGSTTLNTANGTNLLFKVNDAEKMAMTATLLNMSVPIAMGTSKITGLGDGSAAQDAMAFGQKYALEQHDNAYHSTNYKPDFSENTAFNKDFGTAGTEVCVGNDSRLSDARTPTVHNNTYHDPDYKPDFSENSAFNKNFGTTADTVCVGNDARLSDARTPTQHALDSATYHTIDANTTFNATTTKHGFLKQLDDNASNFMNGQGNWAVPSGSAAPNTYYVTTESEFSSAITSIGTGFGIIIFNTATITLTSALLVNGGGKYIIESFGDNTVIDIGGNWNAFYITSAASCILRNFKIDATDLTSTTTYIINVVEASNNKVIVDNVKIIGDGINGYGIRFTSNNIVVKNCWIQDVYNAIITSGGDHCKIIKNTCYSNNYHGIYLDGGDHCIVSGNHSFDNTRDGIYLSDSASHNVISGNYIHNNYVGIHMYSNANDNSISNNVIYDNVEEGIYHRTSHNCSLVGNTCYGNGTCGIWLNASSNNTLSGNTCNDNDINDGNNFGGIYLSGDSNNNTMAGNTSNNNNNAGAGNGHGIHIVDSACNNNIVGGNTLLGNDVNYNNSGTDTILLGDNTIYNATSWDNDLGTPTKNAVRDKFELLSYIANVLEDTTPQLGGSLDLNDKGITHELQAAVSLVNGDLCYMDGNGKMDKADADAEATCDTRLAMCLDTISADATGTFLLLGKWNTSGLTAGAEYFVSLTAGGITAIRPSTTGQIIRHVGTAVSTTVLFFNPSHTYVEYVES